MFDKKEFAQIIKNIKETYNSQEEFAKKSEIGRTYLSQYMNMKLDEPPKPKILEKLALSSHGITSYDELMYICGYTDYGFGNYNEVKELIKDTNITKNEWTYFWKDFYDLNLTYKECNILDKLEDQFYNILVNPKKLKKDEFYKYYDKDLFNDLTQDEINRIWKAFFIYTDSFNFINGRKNDKNYPMPKLNYRIEENDKIYEPEASQFYMCPVYGQISAGQPNWAEECIEGRIPIDYNLMNIVNPEEHFFLRVNGESMNKVIGNGAYALIHKQDMVEDGEIAVVLVNGYDATLKKFTRQGDLIILEPQSNDDSFKIQAYDKSTSIKILGKYIGKFEINK